MKRFWCYDTLPGNCTNEQYLFFSDRICWTFQYIDSSLSSLCFFVDTSSPSSHSNCLWRWHHDGVSIFSGSISCQLLSYWSCKVLSPTMLALRQRVEAVDSNTHSSAFTFRVLITFWYSLVSVGSFMCSFVCLFVDLVSGQCRLFFFSSCKYKLELLRQCSTLYVRWMNEVNCSWSIRRVGERAHIRSSMSVDFSWLLYSDRQMRSSFAEKEARRMNRSLLLKWLTSFISWPWE